MKIIIIGYGKMGKEIEKICLKKKYKILLKINSKNHKSLNKDILKKCDVAIDFSNSKTVVKNIIFLLENKIPVVSGTTGWDNEINIIQKKCIEKNGTFLHSPNFSIGMNIFFELNDFLAKKMCQLNQYEASISEVHHKDKKDKPSGTAIKLANDICKNIEQKMPPIYCKRKDNIKGVHKIKYSSNIDTISIKHDAHNRKGFAEGALIAAKFIKNKKGIFTMKDVINNK